MVTYDEVGVDDKILLCNDGHVLEIFGFTDAHRYHLALDRPRIEIEERKRSTKVVVRTTRASSTFDVDPAQLDGPGLRDAARRGRGSRDHPHTAETMTGETRPARR